MTTQPPWIPVRIAVLLPLVIAWSGPLPGQQASAQEDRSVHQSIASIRAVGKEGAGFEQAIPAAKRLRGMAVDQLPVLLDALAETNPIAENWLRGVVFDVVRNAGQAPLRMLSDYAMDQSHNPTGRGLAMELIEKQSPETASKLIDKCLNDPSLPLREMAVQQAIERGMRLEKEDPAAAKDEYREALSAARHPRQLSRILDALRELGEQVRAADAFVMITKWHSLAPLDNVGGVGFDAEYPTEVQFAVDRIG